MASGVPFEPPSYEEFRLLAIANQGNLRAIASKLNLAPITLYSYFKRDPKAKEILDEVRGYNTFADCDLAEYVIRYNMTNHKEEPSIAQRAAEFTLDRKGKDRGWIRENSDLETSNEQTLEKFKEIMDVITNSQVQPSGDPSDLNIAESNISNADKS